MESVPRELSDWATRPQVLLGTASREAPRPNFDVCGGVRAPDKIPMWQPSSRRTTHRIARAGNPAMAPTSWTMSQAQLSPRLSIANAEVQCPGRSFRGQGTLPYPLQQIQIDFRILAVDDLALPPEWKEYQASCAVLLPAVICWIFHWRLQGKRKTHLAMVHRS